MQALEKPLALPSPLYCSSLPLSSSSLLFSLLARPTKICSSSQKYNMRIRRNASKLLGSTSVYANPWPPPPAAEPTGIVCELNCSPWDVMLIDALPKSSCSLTNPEVRSSSDPFFFLQNLSLGFVQKRNPTRDPAVYLNL